jgi:hypothetical protein
MPEVKERLKYEGCEAELDILLELVHTRSSTMQMRWSMPWTELSLL